LAQAAAEADAAKQGALAGLREELESAASVQMAEAQGEWQRTMTERESALQAEKQQELEAAEQEHSKQLATLGRKLADTETELAGVREREALNEERAIELEEKLTAVEGEFATTKTQLSETLVLRDQLQAELGETKGARDGLQQELDASQTRVEVLEGNKKELESRVGSLQASKSQLESKLSMAVEKMATDEALLERVRKAMAIGLSLLEEQQNNTYGESTSEMEGASEDAE
jgi:chromosome segregation ATPase